MNKINGIAINDPKNAVLNKGIFEFSHITCSIPAIRGHTIKSAKAIDVISISEYILLCFKN